MKITRLLVLLRLCAKHSLVFFCFFVFFFSHLAKKYYFLTNEWTVFINFHCFAGYIFETSLIRTLIFKFFNVPMFRNVTLKCLTEIAAVSVPHYDEAFVEMFRSTMQQLEAMLPIGKILLPFLCNH